MFSPERYEAEKRAKVGRGIWQCCDCMALVKRGKFQIDHVVPVGVTPGSKLDKDNRTWDDFMRALFCPAENLRLICKPCHNEKTLADKEAMKN